MRFAHTEFDQVKLLTPEICGDNGGLICESFRGDLLPYLSFVQEHPSQSTDEGTGFLGHVQRSV